ncbi:hypothetical protein BDQ17DRAFT_1437077 [Cyathus striatus]|nr:hypothetical protein BDQ17DRAFT_1437077 [Cyathus striatus]
MGSSDDAPEYLSTNLGSYQRVYILLVILAWWLDIHVESSTGIPAVGSGSILVLLVWPVISTSSCMVVAVYWIRTIEQDALFLDVGDLVDTDVFIPHALEFQLVVPS